MFRAGIIMGLSVAMAAFGAQKSPSNEISNPSTQVRPQANSQNKTNSQRQANSQNETNSQNRENSQGTSSQANTGNMQNSAMHNRKAEQSQELSEMLNDTNQAREALNQQSPQQAKQDIQNALAQANKITASGGHQMVPLYFELDRYSVIGPIAAAQRNENQNGPNSNGHGYANKGEPGTDNNQSGYNASSAGSNATNSNRNSMNSNSDPANSNAMNSNSNSMDRNSGNPMAVNNVVGQVTAADLDVAAAKTDLHDALQAVDQGSTRSADRDLRKVQDSVVIESVATDLPLLRARENLVLARTNAESGDYPEIQSDLRAASSALGDYAVAGGAHSQDAKNLKSQIDQYDQSAASDHSNATSKIDSWWDQTTGWIATPNATSRTQTHQ